MQLAATPLKPRIGAAVAIDADAMTRGVHAEALRKLLEERGVLVFKGVDLSDAQQLAFAATLGEIIPHGDKGVMKVSLDPKHNPAAEYLKGNIYWHIDGFSDDVPTKASMLTARKLSTVGGQTEVANTYAAYDDLPEKRKREIEKLRVVHTLAATQKRVYPDPTAEQIAGWARMPAKVHPLV
ncbi:MAG: TauD/TfdA family dioxygenase, partial [Parvularculaceae bacterium]|nr:TauD/TfdA family dioxygenase [Parvularculaceae bacterium]